MKKFTFFFVAASFVLGGLFALTHINQADAFGIRAAFRNDSQFFAALFDGNVASSTATSSAATLNAGSPLVGSLLTSTDNPAVLFGSVAGVGTIAIGDTVTVSSSIRDTANATNTSIEAQKFLPAVKIASVRGGVGGNNLDEYIVLYNQMGSAYTASGTIVLHAVKSGTDVAVPLSFATTTVPDRGFFLITSASGYSGGLSPDAIYSTSSDIIASSTTAIYISTTSTVGVNIIDKVEWGASAQITTSTNATSTFAATVATTTLANGTVLVRKASVNSTASTMASGGGESNKGHTYDTRNNAQDFVLLGATQTAMIKNSYSGREFPFGGGQSDTSAPTVLGSYPSAAAGETVPTDLAAIGFGFSEPVNPSTITTSTVILTATGGATNLCGSVLFNNAATSAAPGQCTIPLGTLTAGTSYTFKIKGSSSTPSVADFAGNALNQPAGTSTGQRGNANHDYEISFTPTSGFTIIPSVPPSVTGVYPEAGTSNVPTNIGNVFAAFSQAMDATSFGAATLALSSGGSNVLTNAGAALSADGKSVSIPVASALTANTSYRISIPVSVRNSNGAALASAYTSTFTTASSTDGTGPQVLGKLPNITTGVPVNAIDIHVSTDDALDAATITSSTVQVTDPNSNVIPGTVVYNPLGREIVWTGTNVFQPNTQYTVTLKASGSTPRINNVAGVALQDTDGSANSQYQFSFTTGSGDSTGPAILFTNANTFSLAVTFDEPVKESEAETIGNYALVSGGAAVTLSALNGNTAVYDAAMKTVMIDRLSLTAGNTFSITASNIRDLSNNPISAGGSFSGTVQTATFNGGGIGVGGGYIATTSSMPTGFSSSQYSFVPQPEVRPFNTLAGFTSNYGVGLPISSQIAASGKIILTFPSSFTLANVAADTFSPANSDINGPGTGTVSIAGVAGNDTAHTVTVTLGATATRGGADTHDFLRFDLKGIGNSPVPNTASGYTVDIRTANGTTTLESFTSRPLFITAAGSASLTVSLAATGATNGTTTVYLFSPLTGPLSSSTTAFSGNNATTTFPNLPAGTYSIMTNPIITLTGGVFLGQSAPTPVTVSGATSKSLTLAAAASLASSEINIHASGAKKVSLFAGGQNGFLDMPVTTSNGTTTVTMYYPSDGSYTVGVGPQIDKMFQGAPPAPDYVMPQPVQVNVASGAASRAIINFDLLPAGYTIPGTVTDGSGKVVADANVFAYSPQGGFGTFGQSGSDGAFSLSVAAGSYKVGASAPGFPSTNEIPVVINNSGQMFVNGSSTASASVTIKLSKPSTSISGSITDGTNAVQGAQVWAYCDYSVSGNSCFGPNGHAEAQTDSSGAYTLYVGNGTWKVAAFIPNYGQQPEITVTISGSSATNQNFSPSTSGTTNSVAGTVCTNTGATCSGGTAISGATVRMEGNDPNGRFYTNSAVSGSDGAYTFSNVPSGSGSNYRVRGFAPSLGELPATAPFTVTGNVTSKDLVVAAGRSITVNTSGTIPTTFEAFLRFANTANGVANFVSIRNATSVTLQVSNGSTYLIDVKAPGFNLSATDLLKTSGTATYSTSTGQLDLASGSNAITLTLTLPTFITVGGTVRDASSTLIGNAWVDVNNSVNGVRFGAQANASGTYLMAAQSGSYTIAAYAPGYVANSSSLTVGTSTVALAGTTVASSSVNLIVNRTGTTISGTLNINSSPAPSGFVKGALQGGGTTVAAVNSDGTFSLSVTAGTWTISAAADGYAGATYGTVVVTNASVSGVSINLTTPVTLPSPTASPITPSQGGTVRNSSGTIELSIPANALGSSANSGQVKVTETNGLVQTAGARPVGNGQDIKAYDSSNNSITTLSDNVTISIDIPSSTFASNGLTSTSTAAKLKLGYFDTSLGDWVPIASTVTYENSAGAQVAPNSALSNVDHITISGSVDHFSVFGAIVPTDSLAPAAPSGVSAGVANRTITISWTAPTTNSDGSALSDLMEFEIYRDTSASGDFTTQINSTQVASGTLSFDDPTASAATTYYYKATAADTSGNESSKSSVTGGVSVPAQTVGTGGSSAGGGGGGGSTTTTTTASTSTASAATSTTSGTTSTMGTAVTGGTSAAPTGSGSVAGLLTLTLRRGSENDEVKLLQTWLATDSALYPEGIILGYFGPATERAVQRFQKKYGIVSEGTPATTGYGLVGARTRAKLNEVLGATTVASIPSPAAPPAPSVPAGVLTLTLRRGSENDEVRILQTWFATDSTLYPEGIILGYFGPATERAVQRFQKKYGIVSEGTPATTGYGLVGARTRAKLNEVFGASATLATDATERAKLQAQIDELQRMLDALLKQTQGR